MEGTDFEQNLEALREKAEDLLKAKGYSVGSDTVIASGCIDQLLVTVTERPRQGVRYWTLEAHIGMNPTPLKASFFAGRQPYVEVSSGLDLLEALVQMPWYDPAKAKKAGIKKRPAIAAVAVA